MKQAADWPGWFRNWLLKHPVKHPPALLGRNYTEEVLARITEPRLRPALGWGLGWLARPRFSLALGTVMACVLGVMAVIHSSDRAEADLAEALALIEEMEPSDLLSLEEDSPSDEALLEDLRLLDRFGESSA